MVDEEMVPVSIIGLSTRVVSAYGSKKAISVSDLPELMTSVQSNLKSLSTDEPELDRPDPAIPISKSITKNHIICLEDGQKLKMLKRYLRTRYNLTPEEYRARWGLPADYPMVAPEYAERRSSFAKEIGLGKHRSKA